MSILSPIVCVNKLCISNNHQLVETGGKDEAIHSGKLPLVGEEGGLSGKRLKYSKVINSWA